MATQMFRRTWRTLKVDNPAVATDWSLIAPGPTWLRIASIAARLVADANVANRRVTVIGDDRGTSWFIQNVTLDVTAGQTVDFCGHTGAQPSSGGNVITFPLPHNGLLLMPGHRLRVSTTNLQAGDQWSNIFALVDEVPSDAPLFGDDLLPLVFT